MINKIFILICIIFTFSENCFANITNVDSTTVKSPYELVLQKQLMTRLGFINSNLQDISTSLSNRLRVDSLLSERPNHLVLDRQAMDNIELLNSNLIKLTEVSSFLGLSWDVFITIVVTLLIFILGYIINIVIKRKERLKETEDYRKIVFWGVSSNRTTFTNNIDRLKNFSSQISSTEDMEALRFEYAMTEIYKLSTIPFEKYVSVFLLNSKLKKGKEKEDKNIYNLISTIDYLSRVESMVFEQYDRYKSDFNALFESCNSLYLKIIEILQDKDVKKRTGIINDADEIAHYETLINLITPYVTEIAKPENKERRGSLLFSMFVTPIETEVHRFNNLSSSIELLKILGQFEVLKRQWESNKQGYSLIFADYKSNIETVYVKLESSVNYFENDTKAKW